MTTKTFNSVDEFAEFQYINDQLLWQLQKECCKIKSKFNKFKKQFNAQSELECIDNCCNDIINLITERYTQRILDRMYKRTFTSRTITENVRKSYEHKK